MNTKQQFVIVGKSDEMESTSLCLLTRRVFTSLEEANEFVVQKCAPHREPQIVESYFPIPEMLYPGEEGAEGKAQTPLTKSAITAAILCGDISVSDACKAVAAGQVDRKWVNQVIDLANDLWSKDCDSNIEIDPLTAIVSEGKENGAYISVWAWLSFVGTHLDKEVAIKDPLKSFDMLQAKAEGWCISDDLEIVISEYVSKTAFSSNAEALGFVKGMARYGSEYHKQAIKLVTK